MYIICTCGPSAYPFLTSSLAYSIEVDYISSTPQLRLMYLGLLSEAPHPEILVVVLGSPIWARFDCAGAGNREGGDETI